MIFYTIIERFPFYSIFIHISVHICFKYSAVEAQLSIFAGERFQFFFKEFYSLKNKIQLYFVQLTLTL